MVHAQYVQNQGGEDSRPILAGGAVKDQRTVPRIGDHGECFRQGVPADLEVPQVALGRVLARWSRDGRGFSTLFLQDRGMQVGHPLVAQQASAGAIQFSRSAEVDNASQSHPAQNLEISLGQLVQGVATKELAPSGHTAVGRGIATKVPEITGTDQGQDSLACVHGHIMLFFRTSVSLSWPGLRTSPAIRAWSEWWCRHHGPAHATHPPSTPLGRCVQRARSRRNGTCSAT